MYHQPVSTWTDQICYNTVIVLQMSAPVASVALAKEKTFDGRSPVNPWGTRGERHLSPPFGDGSIALWWRGAVWGAAAPEPQPRPPHRLPGQRRR